MDFTSDRNIYIYILIFIAAGLVYYYLTRTSPPTEPTNNTIQEEPFEPEFPEYPNNELILYYASWCSACSSAMPEWKRFVGNKANTLSGIQNLVIREIRCDGGNETLCFQKDIKGYPTVMLYKTNGSEVEFQNHVTEQNLINFVHQQLN